MKIPANKMPVVKEFPAAPEFMRFQVGFHAERSFIEPVYEGRTFAGHRVTRDKVSIFRFCGHGSTLRRAELMAGITQPQSEIL